jgi:hypothetical protein
MTQSVFVDAAPTTSAPERKREHRPVAFWLFILAAAMIAVGVVVCDASLSLTPDQRIQAYTGMLP